MSEGYSFPKRIIDIHNHLGEDGDPDELLRRMDRAGVERTLIMGTFHRSNEQIRKAFEAHPDRFTGGACIDPREPDVVEQLDHYHGEGFHVVKLFPNLGYYPDAEQFTLFFDHIAELGMAVLSHCGWLSPKAGVTAAYYSHPGRFEKVVRAHPDTPFIMAHMGGIAGFLETVMLTTRTPNTYTDCSPGQGAWVLDTCPDIAATIPPEKLMWGADSHELQHWLDHNRAALGRLGFGPHFEKIFYTNARGILERIGAIPGQP